jgi:hypothetical protein
MNKERYLEINSAHRNRQQFPFPSYFDVPFAFSQPNDKGIYAKDPVLNGMIYFSYKHSTPLDEGVVGNGSTDSLIVLKSNNINMPILPDYYTGCIIMISTPSGIQTRTVNDYSPSLLSIIPRVSFNGISPSQPYVIIDFSTREFVHFIVPDKDANHIDLLLDDQSCTGYYIVDETLSYGTNIVARLVNYYDYSIRYAYYDKEMPPEWQSTDSYTIRKSLPNEKWTLSTPYTLEGGFLYITLPTLASGTQNFYKGMYVYFYTSDQVYSTYYIVAYDGFMRRLKCHMNPSQDIQTNPIPSTGDTINIVTFSHDNYSPLNYIGSMVSINETVCYEVAILRLILPNVPLRTGARIAFYPYVYVELTNITSPTGASQNIFYSNNPESGRALFIVPSRDMVAPINSHFVKLIGRTRQTIKFKPNDSFRFSVYLPTGELFLPSQDDLMSPYDPNYRLQIEAIFAIKRL